MICLQLQDEHSFQPNRNSNYSRDRMEAEDRKPGTAGLFIAPVLLFELYLVNVVLLT